MSRAGYSDDCDGWDLIRWRGAVKSAIRGKRGQAFLREMLAALDALPEKRLVEEDLVRPSGEVCALGAVAISRGLDVTEVDPEDRERVAERFGIAGALAAEIAYENDECGHWHSGRGHSETPEERFNRMREWVVAALGVKIDGESNTTHS